MSYHKQAVSPEPSSSSSQKGKQKAPSENPQDVAGESAAGLTGRTESHETPSELRNPSPNAPSFKPFFTLIEDANSADHHNPTVHYIFSDDDTDLITEAALRSLEPDGAAPLPPGSYDDDGGDDHDAHRREPKHSSLPPLTPGVQEHYIVLDMQPTPAAPPTQTKASESAQDPETTTTTTTATANTFQTSYTISSAHSLTPTWQVLDTELCPAPTFETSPNQGSSDSSDPSQGGLMLKIKGTSGYKPGPIRGRGNNQQTRDQSLEEMMEQFEKRMDELRRVIEAGDVGSAADGKQESGEGEGEAQELGQADDDQKGKDKAVEEAR